MSTPPFEVRSPLPLRRMPEAAEPWMVLGKVYVVVLRRASAHALPEAEVRDPATDAVLARYDWPAAREMFVMDEG